MNSTTPHPRPICILGLGLIGGSLLRALTAAGHPAFGYDPSPIHDHAYDTSTSLTTTLTRARTARALVVLATPLTAIPELLDALITHAPTCDITDVASVKKPVAAAIHERNLDERYIGSHPMTGTEHSGWDAGNPDLFRNTPWVLTYDHALDGHATPHWIALFRECAHMAELVGAHTLAATSTAHDEAVARISHLPHIFAEVLADAGAHGGPLALRLAAGSFRDSTRIAGTRPELVDAMLNNNAPALSSIMDDVLERLVETRAKLRSTTPDTHELSTAGHAAYERYLAAKATAPTVDIHPGKPGWITDLTRAEKAGAYIRIQEN